MSSPSPDLRRHYLQEFVEGDACAAVYIGHVREPRLIGVTRQLVGESWLHAAPFHYCGSIGTLVLAVPLREKFESLGRALTSAFGLRGLFGVDCVLRDGVPYPVEVNPRYTASVEVLEHATGTPALDLHRRVFEPDAPRAQLGRVAAPFVGKAILFARSPLTFPADGPWMATLRHPKDVWELPPFADIPEAGTPIRAGRPILTLFARADSSSACRTALQQIAAGLDAWLYSS
jgi:predicted ATP-grasp superfamily ATP-dependent carboligase